MLTPDQEQLLSIEAGNLQSAGASMPVIIDMINNMAAQLSCDSACQKRKQEDKLRGIEVGADAYIVKGDFEQSNLIETLQNLLA